MEARTSSALKVSMNWNVQRLVKAERDALTSHVSLRAVRTVAKGCKHQVMSKIAI